MKSPIPALILLIVISCFIPSALAAAEWTDDETALIKECENALSYRRFPDLVTTARKLSKVSRESKNSETSDLAMAFNLYGSILADTDSMTDILAEDVALRLSDTEQNSKLAKAWLNTALAEYEIAEIDYSKATGHALDALKQAESIHDDDLSVVALGQLARIYSNKEDKSGIKWARQCHSLAQKRKSPSGRYVSSVNLGSYLLKEQNYEQAATLFAKADSIAHEAGMKGEFSYLDTFRAEIYIRLKQFDKAEQYFRKALSYNESTIPRDRWYARISYGNFLNSRHRWREAIKMFQEAEKISLGRKPYPQEYYAYFKKAEALEAIGNFHEALEAYKEFNRLLTEAISTKKEKEIANLEVRYKVAEQESINSRQSMELMRRNRDFTLALAICALLLILLVAGTIFHIRRIRYSKRMAEINLKAASRERQLRLQLAETLKQKEKSQQSGAEHMQERLDQLYLQLNLLMEQQYVYRDSSLTLEKLASLLSTNRTYLSQAIKLKTGATYSSYINELRLNEAIRVLSTSEESDIIKTIATSVGFYNPSNFYRLFKQKTGLSPAQFRQQAYKQIDKSTEMGDHNDEEQSEGK